jgi:acyl carrier protein
MRPDRAENPQSEPQDSLFRRGVLDSQGVISMVVFCEEMFDIEILDEDAVPENFERARPIASDQTRASAVAR